MPRAQAKVRAHIRGRTEPRIAPPTPAHSALKDYEAAAKELDLKLFPWQRLAARHMTGTEGKLWKYREVAIIIARQNGKTTLLLPRILMGLRRGERILHTAQNRELPRETFELLAHYLTGKPGVDYIRWANGQQTIRCTNGGRYTLVAPRPGVRGNAVDTVLLDEVREQPNFALIAGIKPTLTASRNPQIIYLSNAGSDSSVVLNDLRRRMNSDPRMAYLEWSAAPERGLDDVEGWIEANPAMGWSDIPMYESIADDYRSMPAPDFETEHLCRWVITMQPRMVSESKWLRARGATELPRRPVLGISMDPSGTRASGVIAWQQTDGRIACQVVADVTGEPIDTDRFAVALRTLAIKRGVSTVAFDTLTDQELAKYFKRTEAVIGKAWANASENFVRVIDSGRLIWDEADAITNDLAWTARKPLVEGAWQAVKANEDRPITGALAAIRAVWLASGERPAPPKVF